MKPMEPGLIEQRLAWLEEQHTKANQQATKLSERVKEAEAALAKVSRQGQELSADVSRVVAAASRLQQFEDTLHRHRQEVARLLGEAEERRSGKEKTIQQMHAAELEEVSRGIAEIRMDLDLLGEVQQSLDARREEELKISRTLDVLRKQLDMLMARDSDRAEALASLDDEHRQETRRSAEAQAELALHRERVDGLVAQAEQLEDQARRMETKLAELSASEGERQQLLNLWLEQQNLRQAEQDHGWREWERRFQAFEKRSAEIDERILVYEETYRGLRQLRDDLGQLVERTERRINEVTEMQRLAEERLKHDWTSFQADDAKRWNAHKLTLDEQWREHARGHDKLSSTISDHEEQLGGSEERLKQLEGEAQSRLAELHALVREWALKEERSPKEPRRSR
jgi:chromosome segregation ATPase